MNTGHLSQNPSLPFSVNLLILNSRLVGHVFDSQPQLRLISCGDYKPKTLAPEYSSTTPVNIVTSTPNADRMQIVHEGSQNKEIYPGAGHQEQALSVEEEYVDLLWQ